MTTVLDTFFGAWSEADADARRAAISAAMAPDFRYSDPRSGGRIDTLDALTDYVGMFSANAPGWTAGVKTADEVNGFVRALVSFGGKGPDGSEMVQHGTYFAELDEAGRLVLLAGFVGGAA